MGESDLYIPSLYDHGIYLLKPSFSSLHKYLSPRHLLGRYFLLLTGLLLRTSTFYVHWDDDEGTSRIVTLEVLILGEDSEGGLTLLDATVAVSVSSISIYASRILQDYDTILSDSQS